MNLTEDPDIIQWPASNYLFVEMSGPFQEIAPQTWQLANASKDEIAKHTQISGKMTLYKIKPAMIYRAGFVIDAKPAKLPARFQFTKFEGGKYLRFVLTGSYAQLPEACGRVFKIIQDNKLPIREGFFIENYVNDPKTTPEAELITEILIPTLEF